MIPSSTANARSFSSSRGALLKHAFEISCRICSCCGTVLMNKDGEILLGTDFKAKPSPNEMFPLLKRIYGWDSERQMAQFAYSHWFRGVSSEEERIKIAKQKYSAENNTLIIVCLMEDLNQALDLLYPDLELRKYVETYTINDPDDGIVHMIWINK